MKALDGVIVLDLTRMLAGPFTTMILGDLGAEVIKIEDPENGDPTRDIGPFFVDGMSAYFISINRNKKSLALDLKSDKGREIFYKLVEKADVVVDNFRPGVLSRLGIEYETLKKINPKIICCSISAYGEEGPKRDHPAFDLAIQAYSGAMSVTGEPGRAPVRMGIPIGDLAGGLYGAISVLAALQKRERTGEGCRIELSLLDCTFSLLTYMVQYYLSAGYVTERVGSGHPSIVPYQAFETRDGYLVVAVFTERIWEGFCKALGLEKLVDDPRFLNNSKRVENREALIPILQERFHERSTDEWLEILNRYAVPCSPINTIDKVVKDEQIRMRNMVVEFFHPTYGRVKTLGTPVKMHGEMEEFDPAPTLGEQSERILTHILGLSEEEVRKLKEDGVIGNGNH
jgi:formyl-CoA transferase/CoA:oxalate CoA-transferase